MALRLRNLLDTRRWERRDDLVQGDKRLGAEGPRAAALLPQDLDREGEQAQADVGLPRPHPPRCQRELETVVGVRRRGAERYLAAAEVGLALELADQGFAFFE